MIKAGTYNITIQEGDSGTIVFTFPNSYPLAGKTALLQVKKDFQSEVVAQFSTDNGGFTIDDLDLIMNISSESTQGKAGKYLYDLQLSQTNIETVIKGTFTIEPTVCQ